MEKLQQTSEMPLEEHGAQVAAALQEAEKVSTAGTGNGDGLGAGEAVGLVVSAFAGPLVGAVAGVAAAVATDLATGSAAPPVNAVDEKGKKRKTLDSLFARGGQKMPSAPAAGGRDTVVSRFLPQRVSLLPLTYGQKRAAMAGRSFSRAGRDVYARAQIAGLSLTGRFGDDARKRKEKHPVQGLRLSSGSLDDLQKDLSATRELIATDRGLSRSLSRMQNEARKGMTGAKAHARSLC